MKFRELTILGICPSCKANAVVQPSDLTNTVRFNPLYRCLECGVYLEKVEVLEYKPKELIIDQHTHVLDYSFFVDRRVKITWTDPKNDWNYFRLLNHSANCVCLQGVYDPETKIRHEGDTFWVKKSDIATIEVI